MKKLMNLDYEDEIMQDDDWLYEEDKPKKKTNKFNVMRTSDEKIQPPEWTLKNCKTIDDPEEKERIRKELEKKEREKQNNQSRSEKMKAYWAGRRAEKEANQEPKKEYGPTNDEMTFVNVNEYMKKVEKNEEKPEVDTSLERLAKLREMAETTETENTTTEIESVTTEELTEIVTEPTEIVSEPTEIVSEPAESVPDQEVVVEEIAHTIADDITLVLTSSEAESLYEFIKDELLTVVKRDDIEELDWLADMCSIYKCLRGELVRDA